MPDCPRGYEIPATTSSRESIEWASHQLHRCVSTHTKCTTSQSGSSLPRRILDIGQDAGDTIRLYETDREMGRYASLSYCWGRQPFLQTVTANLNDHRVRIPADELPPTHRDAIDVTRQLGLRYLWIDSLCIIQDSDEDWRREAADMASIYQGSYLVISAAKSGAAGDGLFSTVAPKFAPHKLTVDLPGDDDDSHPIDEVSARIRFTHTAQPLPAATEETSALPVFSRGWTFQERFLASRVVHFTAEELAWECLEESACQCAGPETHPQSRAAARAMAKYAAEGGQTMQPKLLYNPSHWRDMGEMELRRCWHDMVEDHSCLELTFESDVFPATSGLAKGLRRVRESGYLAGLWETSLLADLCWYVPSRRVPSASSEVAPKSRPSRWRAPTWSWASVLGPVRFMTVEDPIHPCQVLEAHCTPVGTDPTGQLVGGHLLLKGLLVPTDLLYKAQAGTLEAPPWQILDLGLLRGWMGNQHADYDPSLAGPGHLSAGSTVYCFLVGQARPTDVLCFLVLRRVDDDNDTEVPCHVYERLGFAELFVRQFSNRSMLEMAESAGEVAVVKIV